jgi:hypothetical protein
MKLPDFEKAFDYENNFYLTCNINRISKILAHYELYKSVMEIPGAIVECGVFKGASLIRFAAFRNLLGSPFTKKIIGFDTFDTFPETEYAEDKKFRQRFVSAAGEKSISRKQLMEVLRHKGTDESLELVEGDITKTVPDYVKNHPELRISLLNLDTDIYEPAVTALEYLYPRIVTGGVLLIDDYGVFPGETKAVEEYFKDKKIKISKFSFCMTPCFVVKHQEWIKNNITGVNTSI